ncbi:presqualene diphosphate synthase HpnD [Methylovirgula sp. 4M-Z18]|uniref:presqualene diphosphate synthase HpnD n=1 Tax=Methylovirgula sp. 4M-Z18 TaxID=2293567 RepID=UPI000E2F268A|nr:presqualene diphosphate synthase HpnD [Methylovirgula sp. 4M-Z18]RFB76425.1 squalene synthase HpnD [Methylovirgula sp. 4M-Z18]
MTAMETQIQHSTRAKGSSFYAAMRILPRPQREAMYAVYDICREIDDVADEGGTSAQRLAELENWSRDLDTLYAGGPPGRFAEVAGVVEQYRLDRNDWAALLEGMTMDAKGNSIAPSFATLDHYCDCVASAVGRLSNRIFGIGDDDSMPLAHHLGRALQLTNILRDLDEDAGLGRLYLPEEALREAHIESRHPSEVLRHPALDAACRPVTARAHEHFRQAAAVWERIPRSKTRAPRLMGAVYRLLLDRLEARGFQGPRERVRLDRLTLIGLLVRHGFF